MIVKKLELENFRNYKSLDLDLFSFPYFVIPALSSELPFAKSVAPFAKLVIPTAVLELNSSVPFCNFSTKY